MPTNMSIPAEIANIGGSVKSGKRKEILMKPSISRLINEVEVDNPEETISGLRYDNRALQERIKRLEEENEILQERLKQLKTKIFAIVYPELYEKARQHPILSKLL